MEKWAWVSKSNEKRCIRILNVKQTTAGRNDSGFNCSLGIIGNFATQEKNL